MVKKKRYLHDYVDGELVRDLALNETFVFMDKHSGFTAQSDPQRFRRANEEEKRVFAEYASPTRP